MKVVADVLGVARANLVEQICTGSRSRGPYRRADDEAVLIAIRAITDVRPTYGYRRVTAILDRTRRATGELALNHMRVFRLMKRDSLLLQRHTGGQPVRAHEGRVIAGALAREQRGERGVREDAQARLCPRPTPARRQHRPGADRRLDH